MNKKQAFFTSQLLLWSANHPRDLPWKATKNPYNIWLSEIILQQTRVEQGTPYYLKFIAQYPTVQQLAEAPEDEVLKLWEGLGYYSRARNLHVTAKRIHQDFDGIFPNQYEAILDLKGVGQYTAAAIASFAFDLSYAVVDGNVYRVLSRYFGIKMPVDSTKGKKKFAVLAQQLLDQKQPAIYNQAIMDFGATHCLPKQPKCTICPLQSHCSAIAQNAVADYPVKEKKLQKRTRYFHYILFNYKGDIWVEKRQDKDIWKGLYQFPLIEKDDLFLDKLDLQQEKKWEEWMGEKQFKLIKISKAYKQTLTHQYLIANFWEIKCEKNPNLLENKYTRIERLKLRELAFPKGGGGGLKDKNLYLFP